MFYCQHGSAECTGNLIEVGMTFGIGFAFLTSILIMLLFYKVYLLVHNFISFVIFLQGKTFSLHCFNRLLNLSK